MVDRVDDYLHPLPLQSMDATHLGEIELRMNVRWPRDLLRKFSLADDPVQDDALRDDARVHTQTVIYYMLGGAHPQSTLLRNHVILLRFQWLKHEVQDDPESEVPLSSGDDDDDEEFIGETPPPPESRESQPEFEPAKKKRHYYSSVRNPPDPLRRARSDAKKKVQLQTTEEKIRGIQRTTCCGELCCRKVPYEVIRQCRLEYFGLPHDDKEEYIHTRLHMRHQSAIDAGKHIIDQKLICKRAFWTIYGFSKTKYYKMIAQSLDGIVRGYHGNKGSFKPRATTSEAHALLKQLLQQLVEPMPHMQCTFADGSTGVVHMLPSCYTRKSIMRELNAKIASIGGSGISKSLFYTTWASTYKNYKFHKRGAFAKCDTCIKLKLQLIEERRPDFRRPIEEERNEHMREQMSRRSVYYAKRALAKAQPERYLCIIHDKMDQAKTNIPRLADNMKRLHIGGCIPLPISLTGMLTHGREPGIFCHLSLTGLWPGDPNFTVSSLARCLRDLEQVLDNGDDTGDLSRTTSNQSLFTCLLDQTAFKATLGREGAVDSTYFELHGSGSEPTAATDTLPTTFTKLPRAFLLQMDNSAKDNKNIHVLAFCSELVKRGIFDTVEVNHSTYFMGPEFQVRFLFGTRPRDNQFNC
ncbi:hypothetical protein R1sor_005091 [Riccia sorocarpa]|uniref:DUF7869 domain-containing protein n=1 Tax=Riccia sorocarpa TaxID=122646 RepID=A0ABD3HIJ5_9MARC